MLAWRRIAYFICGDWIRAEDLLQQALVRMYVRWSHIDPTAVDAYARTVITRLAIDDSRRAYRRSEVIGAVPEQAHIGPDLDDALLVRDALQRIPTGQRAAVVLRYFQGLSVAETAAVLGVSQGAVKSQTSRGLSALRAVLTADGGEDAAFSASDDSVEARD